MIPKISIILPVYNVERWLDETVQSIQAQTLQEWEAVFVIDGSPDKSNEILQHYASTDERIIIIKQENQGQGAARDHGVKHAKGDYLFFLDPDDLIPPNALDEAYKRALATNADIIVGDYIEFKDGTRPSLIDQKASNEFHRYFSQYGDKMFYRRDISGNNFFYHSLYFMVVWMKLFKRETWLENEIKAPVGLTMGEDFMTVKKMLLLHSSIATVDAVLIYYRKRENSSTTLRSEKAFGIFESFDFTRRMYEEIGMDRVETSYMHAAYLDWFYAHLTRFTPFTKMYEFYKNIKESRKYFLINSLDQSLLGRRRIAAIKATSLPGLFGFGAYLILMSNTHNFFKVLAVQSITLVGRLLPNPIHKKINSLLIKIANHLQHKPASHRALQKVIYHFQRKTH